MKSPPGTPITSVWEGNDTALIKRMLEFYASIKVEPILHASGNEDPFQKESGRKVISIESVNNHKMEGVPDKHCGSVIYAPPHIGTQSHSSQSHSSQNRGTTAPCGAKQGWTLSYLYPPFLKQARRILKVEGLLLAKITDMVNNHRSRWTHCDFMDMATKAGFTVCDLIIKIKKDLVISDKWRNTYHARKQHSFWIICRNGKSCERLKMTCSGKKG